MDRQFTARATIAPEDVNMSIEKKEDWQLLEQLLDEAFFSDRFRRRTASFVLPPFAVGALHFASGCAGMNAFWESA
jgi:hypothetical protein